MIPVEAVEAAAVSWLKNWDANKDGVPWVVRERMQEAIEAAAPHMLADLLRHLLKGMEPWAGGKELGFMEGALEAAEESTRPTP